MSTVASRCCWSAKVVGVGAALAALVTLMFAEGRPASAPITLDGLGIAETIQLPQEARKIAEMNSFVVRLNDVDDFGRIFVNNYLVLTASWSDAALKRPEFKDIPDLRISRSNPPQSEADVISFLRVGKNFLVAELENSMLGGCHLRINISINDHAINGFPRVIPKEFKFEMPPVNSTLAERFGGYSMPDPKVPWSGISGAGDAICSRRIFQFTILE
jgi:hypothetical protein